MPKFNHIETWTFSSYVNNQVGKFSQFYFYVTSGYLKLRIYLHMFMKKRIYVLIVTYAHLISITMKSNIKVTSNNKSLLALFNTIAHFYSDVIQHVSITTLEVYSINPSQINYCNVTLSTVFSTDESRHFIMKCTAFIYSLFLLE